MKIENKPVDRYADKVGKEQFAEFCRLLAKLEVGQSFTFTIPLTSVQRAVSGIGYALDRKFVMRSESGHMRVGRVE